MRLATIGTVVVLCGCGDGASDDRDSVDVQAGWRVRCPAGTQPCDYPVRELAGTIYTDDEERRYARCSASTHDEGQLDLFIGRASYTSPTESIPGFAINLYLGYDGGVGFELARQCVVGVGETDDGQWVSECSAAAPSPQFPCQIEAPTLVDQALSLSLRCERMPSVPVVAGREADLAAGTDPALPVVIQMSRCSFEPSG